MMLSPVNVPHTLISKHYVSLSDISRLDHQLFQRFKSKFVVQPSLSRLLVSFQANKTRPVYRWYKFKEAFSASLVEYLFSHYGIVQGRVLDPFAGSGTTLFVASSLGLDADGIELLPIGQEIIVTKQILDTEFTPEDFERLRYWAEEKVWNMSEVRIALPELRITRGAYSEKTKEAIERYVGALQQENSRVQTVLRFALLCVLESISFTRKDGQYLRWDYRSGRTQGKKIFDKGVVPGFDQAICGKINEIIADAAPVYQKSFFSPKRGRGRFDCIMALVFEYCPNCRMASTTLL